MNKSELDKEITETQKAVKELKEAKDEGALKLARSDLSYFLSLLNN